MVKKADIFEGQVHVVHTGKDFGPMHPKSPDFADRIQKLLSMTGQERFLVPRLGFKTRVFPIDPDVKLEDWRVPGLVRISETSDGIVTSLRGETHAKIAVLMMTADCGMGKILAPDGSLAVLHCMIDTLDHADGSSIVTNAIKNFMGRGINPSQLRFQIGEAARVCCLGFNDPEKEKETRARSVRLVENYGADVSSVVKNLPRKGGIGFDISLIAARQAEKSGIRDVEVEDLCISCNGAWFSNLREDCFQIGSQNYRSRNAVVVYVD